MGNGYLDAALTFIAVIILWLQTRSMTGQPWRKRAFQLGAGAALAMGIYSALGAANLGSQDVLSLLLWLGFGLLALTVIAFLFALRNGELRADRKAFEATMRAEGARRSQAARDQQHKRK